LARAFQHNIKLGGKQINNPEEYKAELAKARPEVTINDQKVDPEL
jgi:hypothetical protein